MAKIAEPVATETKPQAYEKPEVRTEEVFETLALTCSKVDSQQCPTAPGELIVRS